MHGERLTLTVRLRSAVLIAQAVFLGERKQTDAHRQTNLQTELITLPTPRFSGEILRLSSLIETSRRPTLCTGSKAVLESLEAISISAATAVEEHLAPSDFVVKVPLVLSIQTRQLCLQNTQIT